MRSAWPDEKSGTRDRCTSASPDTRPPWQAAESHAHLQVDSLRLTAIQGAEKEPRKEALAAWAAKAHHAAKVGVGDATKAVVFEQAVGLSNGLALVEVELFELAHFTVPESVVHNGKLKAGRGKGGKGEGSLRLRGSSCENGPCQLLYAGLLRASQLQPCLYLPLFLPFLFLSPGPSPLLFWPARNHNHKLNCEPQPPTSRFCKK